MITTRGSFALVVILASVCAGASPAFAQATPSPRWDGLQFLLGTWTAAGGTQLGTAEGGTTFAEELDGQIITRRNFAIYTGGAAAGTRHDDLLIVYRDTPEAAPHAIYFDSEGHVIRYTITTSADTAAFQSDPSQPGPRYRLTYRRAGDALSGVFAVAAPGTDDYKTYLSWTSTKSR